MRISTDLFRDAIKRCAPFAPKNSVIEILSFIKVVLNEKSMTFVATDASRFYFTKVDMNSSENGEYLIEASPILTLLLTITDKEIDVVFGEKETTVKTSSGKYSFGSSPASEFIDCSIDDLVPAILLNKEDISLLQNISTRAIEAKEDILKPFVNYCCIDGNIAYSTNTLRIARIILTNKASSVVKIPGQMVSSISNLIDAQVSISGNNVVIEQGSDMLVYATHPFDLPDFKRAIPAMSDTYYEVERVAFLSCMKRASVSGSTFGCSVSFEQDLLVVSGSDTSMNRSFKETIVATGNHECTVSIEHKSLIALLSGLSCDTLKLYPKEGIRSPLFIKWDDSESFILQSQVGL